LKVAAICAADTGPAASAARNPSTRATIAFGHAGLTARLAFLGLAAELIPPMPGDCRVVAAPPGFSQPPGEASEQSRAGPLGVQRHQHLSKSAAQVSCQK
jgi:hypothetical protein